MRRSRRTAGPPSLDHLTNVHKGETIIVLGNSSSLREMDIYLFDLFRTIGVNRILRMYEPHYVYIGNRSVVVKEWPRMKAAGNLSFILFGGALNQDAINELGRVYRIKSFVRGADPTAMTGPVDIGEGPGNSGYQAAQMAYRMGAKRILLAGIDLHWPRDRHTHFFGDGSKEGCKLRQPKKVVSCFARLKGLYTERNVTLCSISPWDTPLRRAVGYVSLRDEVAHGEGDRCSWTGDI